MGILTGKNVLILEDEWLISSDLAVMLDRADAASAPCFCRCSEAEEFLRHKTPDFAILDLALGDGRCVRIARILIERRVPFIVYSGFQRPSDEEVFSECQWLLKPAFEEDFISAIEAEFTRQEIHS